MSRELLDATVPPAFLFRVKAHSNLKSQVEPQRSGDFGNINEYANLLLYHGRVNLEEGDQLTELETCAGTSSS